MALTPTDMQAWWNQEAGTSPKTAILSGQSDLSDAEFFASGTAWFDQFAAFAASAGVDLRGETALDFGCGMGRMTRALTARYGKVTGIDVSDAMIRLANQRRISAATEFTHVLAPPWPMDDRSVDLAFSTIAVQHVAPPHNARAVEELFRVSRGLVLFDAPSHKLAPDAPDTEAQGIFLLPFEDVARIARAWDFELMALRNFPTTATRQYQYLYKAR